MNPKKKKNSTTGTERQHIKKKAVQFAFFAAYGVFIAISFLLDFVPGQKIGENFYSFFIYLIGLLPCAFILIGLFEVWVKRETVEKHLGEGSGLKSYIWVILLASTTIGGLYVALPLGHSLYRKGARPVIVLAYLGAAAICRIPMTLFEASFLGVKFTAVRWGVSIPLVIVSSILLGKLMEKPVENDE